MFNCLIISVLVIKNIRKNLHMSEKSSTFVGMNDEMKLRLAYAEIARLKDEMATANRGQVDLIAHDQALRADFERQREEDRQFFKAQ